MGTGNKDTLGFYLEAADIINRENGPDFVVIYCHPDDRKIVEDAFLSVDHKPKLYCNNCIERGKLLVGSSPEQFLLSKAMPE